LKHGFLRYLAQHLYVLCEYKVIEGSAGGAVSNRGPKPASGIPLMGDKLGVLEVQPLKFLCQEPPSFKEERTSVFYKSSMLRELPSEPRKINETDFQLRSMSQTNTPSTFPILWALH